MPIAPLRSAWVLTSCSDSYLTNRSSFRSVPWKDGGTIAHRPSLGMRLSSSATDPSTKALRLGRIGRCRDRTQVRAVRHEQAREELVGDVHQPVRGTLHGATDEREAKDRKSTRLNSSHLGISYAVFCLKKKNKELVNAVHH